MALTLSPEELSALDSQIYQELTLEVTIADESQQPTSSRSSVHYLPEDYFIGIHAESWHGQAESELGFTIQTVDQESDPITEKIS